MKITSRLLVRNPCFRAGKRLVVKGLMLHSVGCAQPKASVFLEQWNRESFRSACVHAFIDGESGEVFQTLPWEVRGWHCASGRNGSGNLTHIGVEMCEPGCIRYVSGSRIIWDSEADLAKAQAVVRRTYRAAVELFAELCFQFLLDPLADGVVISHAEGYRRGIASNHADPEHLWEQLGVGLSMDGFRRDVAARLAVLKAEMAAGGGAVADGAGDGVAVDALGAAAALETATVGVVTASESPGSTMSASGSAATGFGESVAAGFAGCPFRVRVQSMMLRIRKGPGTNFAWTGRYSGAGVFTIVERRNGAGSKNGWGRLKSGSGWVSLDFCERV